MSTDHLNSTLQALIDQYVDAATAETRAENERLKDVIRTMFAAGQAGLDGIDLTPIPLPPVPAATPQVQPLAEPLPLPPPVKRPQLPTDEASGEDPPLLVDLSKDAAMAPILEEWATAGKHHLRYEIAGHIEAIGFKDEARTLLLRRGRDEVPDMGLLAAENLVKGCCELVPEKPNQLKLVRGQLQKLFGKW